MSKNSWDKYYQENEEEETEKKWQYGRDWYKNLPEKLKLAEYAKNIIKWRKCIF